MPQTTTVFRILLSSPSDMMADRDAIEEAIEEVSRDLAPSGMTLNTVRWERDSFPGKGTDTQAVVGNQILKDYDILIALIGRRLGTQTPRAESGTVEEIEHAIKKDGSAFENHHIQVFFKEVQISIHNVDIEEISRVRKFRESLGDRGVLYRDFKDAKQLQSHVRGGLKQALRSWESNRQTVESTAELANQEKTSNASQNQNNAIEDIGVLDYLEMHEEGLKEASEHLDHSSKRLESFATYLSKITVELSILNQADANAKKKKNVYK